MPAVFALVKEILGNLRFFRKEVARHIVGNLGVGAFRMTALTAQHPLRVVCHPASVEIQRSSAYPAQPLFDSPLNPSTGYFTSEEG
jgi:hypothetical protein